MTNAQSASASASASASDVVDARYSCARLAALLRRERHAMGDFLVALADFDRRRSWIPLGHPSLFSFLRTELGLSAGAAQYRKTAAELLQRHPEVEAPLRDGRLCLSSVIEAAKVLTAENLGEVLPRFFGLSSRDAAAVAASIRPVEHAPVREVVTFVRPKPDPASAGEQRSLLDPCSTGADRATGVAAAIELRAPETPGGVPAGEATRAAAGGPTIEVVPSSAVVPAKPSAVRPPPRTPQVDPLDAERARLHLTVSRRFLAKLETARAELSHARPGASAEEVLEACLDLLLAQRAKRKALVAKPRSPRAAPARWTAGPQIPGLAAADAPSSDIAQVPAVLPDAPSSDIAQVPAVLPDAPSNDVAPVPPATPTRRAFPAAVRREAWTRAAGRCEWPLEAGGTCGSTLRLELDHVVPVALGGAPTSDNVRVVCRSHNVLAARRALGDARMDRFTRRE